MKIKVNIENTSDVSTAATTDNAIITDGERYIKLVT